MRSLTAAAAETTLHADDTITFLLSAISPLAGRTVRGQLLHLPSRLLLLFILESNPPGHGPMATQSAGFLKVPPRILHFPSILEVGAAAPSARSPESMGGPHWEQLGDL